MKLETRTIYGGFTSAAGAQFPLATFAPTTPILTPSTPGIDFPVPYLLHGVFLSTSINGTLHQFAAAPTGPIGAALILGQHQDQITIDQSCRLIGAHLKDFGGGLSSLVSFDHSSSRYFSFLNGPLLLDPSKNLRLYFFSPLVGNPGLASLSVISTATLYLEATK
jgi:hypothetical protein